MQTVQHFHPFLAFFLLALPCLSLPAQQSGNRDNHDVQQKQGGEENIPATTGETDGWLQLFNGKDLTGWTPKIRGYELGDNFANTFRVEDGVLKVSYDGYEEFGERYGHLFYSGKFSHYVLRVEYRFVGEQVAGGPGWAWRNSGAMLHGQDPATMTVDQNFPVSIEAQFLGGDGKNERTNMNLCTPGTNVVLNGKLFLPHCTNSKSRTCHGDEWVTVSMEVHGNDLIRHMVENDVVLEYTQPQLDSRDPEASRLIVDDQLQLSSGSISLQSESHPIEFRKVELKILPGDPLYGKSLLDNPPTDGNAGRW